MIFRFHFMPHAAIAVALAAGLLPASFVHAQADKGMERPITLAEAVARAGGRAPQVRAANAGLSAAEASVRAARLLPNPTLDLEAENVLGSGPYSRFQQAETTLSMSVPLELGGKRAARTGVARAEQASARIELSAARAELTLRVTQAFIERVASERRLAAANARRELAERSERAASLRVESGKASPIEGQRATAQRVGAVLAADRARRAAARAAATLSRLTGAEAPLALAAPWFDDAATERGIDAHATPLALAAAQARVDAAGARLRAADSERVPDVTVSAGARRFRETNDTAAVLSVSVPIPVFNRGGAELARARAELDKAQAERAAAEIDFAEALDAARSSVADARANAIAAAGPELEAAREAARIAGVGYRAGKFTEAELIEAEHALAEAQEAAVDALAGLHDARARLARLLGHAEPIYKD